MIKHSIGGVRRVFDILDDLQTVYRNPTLLNARVNKVWQAYSLDECLERSRRVAAGLLRSGLQTGDRVAIMAGNCPEWNFVDYGSQMVAMPNVPVYPTINNEDLQYILNHAEVRIIFISDKTVWQKIQAVRKHLPLLELVVSFNPIEDVLSFSDFLAPASGAAELYAETDRIKAAVNPEDLFSILYTSGTTGIPKGVMLSHANILSNLDACKEIVPFSPQWRALSFLPLNHVYERFLNVLYLYHGLSIYYAESIESIGENSREIRPHLFVAVPRVLERVLERILDKGETLKGVKKKIFDASINLAAVYEPGKTMSWSFQLKRKLFDRLVYQKWRAAIGGEILLLVSGGAALNPRIERIFTCAGIPVLQGYGLTETCVVVSLNRFEEQRRKVGTVGIVLDNMQVKIAPEDGEILVKGPSVMRGYYKNPEATAEVFDADGFFRTGDVGKFEDGVYLKITDRKKEIFKNSAGKYIAPMAIENKLKESRFIEQAMVVGEGEKFVSALIVCNAAAFKTLFEKENISWPGNDRYTEHAFVQKTIAGHVRLVNTQLAPFEQIKRQQLLSLPWTIEKGEITPKLSLKRKVIAANHKDILETIFSVG